MKSLSASEHKQLLGAINAVRREIHWKPDSAERHLQKRKRRGHLPKSATLADYEQIIWTVLQDVAAQVYRYWFARTSYVTIVAEVEKRRWLVMFSLDGILESAFVIERPERYLSKPGFELIGQLGEVDDEL
jgi:hypothetical protein